MLLFPLFLGDNPKLMADIPVLSSYMHYLVLPTCISHFMPYCDLMVTRFFSSDHQILLSQHWRSLWILSHQEPQLSDPSLWPRLSNYCSLRNFTSSIHLAWWFVSTHTSLSPLWPVPYCIDILVLILIFFSLTNNSPCVTVPKALLSSNRSSLQNYPCQEYYLSCLKKGSKFVWHILHFIWFSIM